MPPKETKAVTDVALQGGQLTISEPVSRQKLLARLQFTDKAFRLTTRAAAIAVLVLLGGVMLSLLIGSLPTFRSFGFSFLYEQRWNPVTEKFGALAPIYGTIVTSMIAM